MAVRYSYTPISSPAFSFLSNVKSPTVLLGLVAATFFLYIVFFNSPFLSLTESTFKNGSPSSTSSSSSSSSASSSAAIPYSRSLPNNEIEMDYLEIYKLKATMNEWDIEKQNKRESQYADGKDTNSIVSSLQEMNRLNIKTANKKKENRIEMNNAKDDVEVEQQDHIRKKPPKPKKLRPGNSNVKAENLNKPISIPKWVLKYGVSHLFDWTWKKNNDSKRYKSRMSLSSRDSTFFSNSPSTVNDVRHYLLTHPEEGILIDDFEQLKNPIPHPLPRTAKFTTFHKLCEKMNLNTGWLACRMNGIQLSTSQPYTTRFINAAIFNGFIDSGSCNEVVPGTVFTNTKTFHFQQWSGNPCYNSPITAIRGSIEEYDEIADSVGTFTTEIGHFPNQQLPRLIRMAATVPNTTKLLVATGGIADGFLDVLINRGIFQKSQLVSWNSNHVYYGKTVFRSESWPYLSGEKYNHYLHDRTDMELMHKVFVDDVHPIERNKLIVIQRKGTREISNHNKLVELLEKYVNKENEKNSNRNSLEIEIFKAEGTLQDHINLFKKARLVVGPHGAGFINLMWCASGTHAIEIGYNAGMPLPSMYFEVATHSNLQYWLLFGQGDYGGSIVADENELNDVFKTVIQQIQQTRKEEGVIQVDFDFS